MFMIRLFPEFLFNLDGIDCFRVYERDCLDKSLTPSVETKRYEVIVYFRNGKELTLQPFKHIEDARKEIDFIQDKIYDQMNEYHKKTNAGPKILSKTLRDFLDNPCPKKKTKKK